MTDPGAKHDAGKLPVADVMKYFPRAIEAVAAVIAHGETLHGYNTWHTIPDAERRYDNAGARHAVARCKGQAHDTEGDNHSGLLHRAHEAFNSLAALELELRK